jgi:leader peptidase (prepilin peptidase) / N-methyltransferase
MATTSSKWTATPGLRSPLIIAGTLTAAAVVAVTQESAAAAVLRSLLVLLLVPCAVVDLEHRIIPNRLTGYGSLAAIVAGLTLNPAGEPQRLLWAAVAGGFLLAAALANPAGMGMGDVKLLGMMGLFLGRPVIIALLLALVGSVFAAVAIAARRGVRAARKTGLPFGPYLGAGGIVAAFVGEPLIHAYLNLHG